VRLAEVTQLISTDIRRALIGIGVTGLSVARFLQSQGREFDVYDSRDNPPGLDVFKKEFPGVQVHLGALEDGDLCGYSEVILSPGIDPKNSWVQSALQAGVKVFGDIELFAQAVDKPVIAITGSNAKSTVTSLVAEMAKADGFNVGVGGNLGTAALDLLEENVDLYVLELSSFQLELVGSLTPVAACVLNLSADHMDRYASMLEYHAAKQRIYKKAERLIFNREDELTQPLVQDGQTSLSFGLDNPDINDFGLLQLSGETWLVRGHHPLIAADDVALKGSHNHANVLAAMALAEAVGISESAMKKVAREFAGLPHRCQLVSRHMSVQWIDDSKATNVGAVVAALEGLGLGKNIVLIAGGQAKGQKFDELKSLIKAHVKQLVLIGQDADKLASVLQDCAPILFAVSMDAAVQVAAQSSQAGDIVLLSPACASFDMFNGYEHRGNEFARAVEALV